jgi:hypothetical protein
MRKMFRDAIDRSREYFLNNSEKRTGLYHQTTVQNAPSSVGLHKCLVMPPLKNGQQHDGYGIIYEPEIEWETHRGSDPGDRNKVGLLRLNYLVTFSNGTTLPVDPFDIRKRSMTEYEARIDNANGNGKQWTTCVNPGKVYILKNEENTDLLRNDRGDLIILLREDIADFAYSHIEAQFPIQCPSLVFVYQKAKETRIYNAGKMMANAVFGVQSQVVVSSNRKSSDQMLSNLALKINAKLSNGLNRSRGWDIQYPDASRIGLPWVNECPTLVIGLATAKRK